MKVCIGSTNPVKVQATKDAFSRVLSLKDIDVVSLDVNSGVRDQPMSDAECIEGATTRARGALREGGGEYGVGIEAGLQAFNDVWINTGWVVVVDTLGNMGVGSSVGIKLRDDVMRLIQTGKELGEANDSIFGLTNSKQANGNLGIMTGNRITRTGAYTDAVVSALCSLKQPNTMT